MILIILKNQIDSVIHLAANLIIGEGEKFPKKYFKNNVLGTKNLLEACKNTSIKNFVFSNGIDFIYQFFFDSYF